MPARFALRLFLLLAPSVALADTLPSIIVAPGETRYIEAQRHELSEVTVHKGGRLVVSAGRSILHLVVKGNMTLHGSLEASAFSSEEADFTFTIPNHPALQISMRNDNRGGIGGYGGAASVNVGGQGAVGNADAGGGGGGGGARILRPQADYTGRSATGEVGGGWAGPACGSPGGNGARRNRTANGGIVFLEVAGDFDGTDGVIDVRGVKGDKGNDGEPPHRPGLPGAGCIGGGGGGGGGGPGGQGGSVVGVLSGNVIAYPRTFTSGGEGGEGGLIHADGKHSAARGTRGERGSNGRVFWF